VIHVHDPSSRAKPSLRRQYAQPSALRLWDRF
jgi:hypothetical protein